MSTYHLEELFAPKSIALVGASPRERSLGRIVLTRLREAGFQGQIHLVNPKYREIDGVATVQSIEALPAKPDLVVITAPAPAVPGIVKQSILEYARAEGLRTIEGQVLNENTGMPAMCRELGLTVAPDSSQKGVSLVRLDVRSN